MGYAESRAVIDPVCFGISPFVILSGTSVDSISEQRRKHVPAQRFGQPDEFGACCAFICSIHAGFLTGQNLLLDGGSYPGMF